MAVYVKKTCGNCGFVTQSRRRDDDGLKIANPLSVCPRCNSLLVDGNKKEYVMFNAWDYIRYFIFKILIGWFLGFLIGGIAMAIINQDNPSILWIICIIIMALYFWLCIKNFNEEREDSIRRTKDIKYLNQLLKLNLITEEKYEHFKDLYNIKDEDEKHNNTKANEKTKNKEKKRNEKTETNY